VHRALSSLVLAAACVSGCGNQVWVESHGAGRDMVPSVDAGAGGHAGGAPTDTECTSRTGLRICHGAEDCPSESPECDICIGDFLNGTEGDLSVCANDAWFDVGVSACWKCPDGSICGAFAEPEGDLCGPYELGLLFEQAGGADRLRYADHSRWTGEPLPEPTTCPEPGGAEICGPSCPACPGGQVCTGRSPRHPHGVCVLADGDQCMREFPHWCAEGMACFVFAVEADMQPLADEVGHCLPLAQCISTASQLPGGAECIVPE
jgi:hypothetical protein